MASSSRWTSFQITLISFTVSSWLLVIIIPSSLGSYYSWVYWWQDDMVFEVLLSRFCDNPLSFYCHIQVWNLDMVFAGCSCNIKKWPSTTSKRIPFLWDCKGYYRLYKLFCKWVMLFHQFIFSILYSPIKLLTFTCSLILFSLRLCDISREWNQFCPIVSWFTLFQVL